MPQEKLPKNLEKKLIHTPANQMNPITSSTTPASNPVVVSSHVVTSSNGAGIVSVSNVSASVSPQMGQGSGKPQFILSNNTTLSTVRPLGWQEQQSQSNQTQVQIVQAQPRYQLREDQIQQLINQPLSQQQTQQQQLLHQSDSLSIQSQTQQVPPSSSQAGQPGFLNKILLDGCKSLQSSKQLQSTLNPVLIGWDKQLEKKGK